MNGFDDHTWRDNHEARDEPRSTPRQIVIRLVAGVLLLSFLGTLYLSLRGIEGVFIVIGLLAAIAVVASMAKKQRDSENPYRTEDPPDLDIQ